VPARFGRRAGRIGRVRPRELAIYKLIYFAFFGLATLSILRWPAIAGGILLATYALEQSFQSRDGFFYERGDLTNQATALLILFAVFVRFAKGERTFFPLPREAWVFLGLFGYHFVSTLWSPYSGAVANFYTSLPIIMAFGLLLSAVVHRPSELRSLLYTMILIGAVVVPLLLFTVDWASRSLVFKQGAAIGSLKGDSGNPLAIATFAGYVCLGAAMLQLKGAGRLLSLARWALVLMAFFLCMRTASRGQVVAIAVAFFVFFPLAVRPRNVGQFMLFLVIAAFIAVGGYFIFQSFLASDSARWQLVGSEGFWNAYSESRGEHAALLVRYWAEAGPVAWIFGIGGSGSYSVPNLEFYCHIVVVEAMCELGLPGLVGIWLVPIFTALSLKRVWNYVRDDAADRGAIMALGSIFLFEVILSFKQGVMIGSSATFAFAVIVGRILRTFDDERAYYESLDNDYHLGQAYNETESQFDSLPPADAGEPSEGELALPR
jgi:hypothetical protein